MEGKASSCREQPTLSDCLYGSVTLGERGQIVIPAQARKDQDLRPGDKLLVFRHPHGPVLMLVRVEDLRAMIDEIQQWSERAEQMSYQHQEEGEEST